LFFVVLAGAESQENVATRGKMERLRLIMEERRARRRARREARSAPYWGAGAAPAAPDGHAPVAPAGASPQQRACATIAASASPDEPMEAADELLAPEAVLA
jgi:hypothetical protein